jgi:uncharacterized protein YidB (DUF937 family)
MALQDVLGKIGGNQGQQGGLDNIQQLFGGGGLAGIVTQLSQNGMGTQVQSWIGSGQNQPISGSDVQRAVDSGKLQKLAQRQGMTTDEYSNHIAKALPEMVDRATPEGMIPQQSSGNLRNMINI